MSLIHDPSQFNKRIGFGTVQSAEQPNGVSKPTFVPSFTVWGKKWRRSISQEYQLVGTSLQDTVTLIIRHNSQVLETMKVQLDGETYDIVSYNPDESSKPVAYDSVTVKKVKK